MTFFLLISYLFESFVDDLYFCRDRLRINAIDKVLAAVNHNERTIEELKCTKVSICVTNALNTVP